MRGTTAGANDNTGIFRVDSNGAFKQLIRENQAALSGNRNFGDLSASTNFAFNNAGMMAMMKDYISSITGSTGSILYVSDSSAPGQSPGQMQIGTTLSLGIDAISQFELGGNNLGQFDQVLGLPELWLNSSDLAVSLYALYGGFTLTDGMNFTIFDLNGSSGGLTGQFSGLSEKGLVGNFGGTNLFITYAGGNGNDVALFTAIPEPSSFAMTGLMMIGCVLRRRWPKSA